MAKEKQLTDAERRQIVAQDRKNWAPDSDQDDRELGLIVEIFSHEPGDLK